MTENNPIQTVEDMILRREDNIFTGEITIWDDKGNINIYSQEALLKMKKLPNFIADFQKPFSGKEIK